MATREDDSDSEAPEEFTAQQAIQQDEEISKVQRENKASFNILKAQSRKIQFDMGACSTTTSNRKLTRTMVPSLILFHKLDHSYWTVISLDLMFHFLFAVYNLGRVHYSYHFLESLTGAEQPSEIGQHHFRASVVREGKERRRQWAQKLTPRPSRADKSVQNETEMPQESEDNQGMLPDDIVKLLAAQEKKVFSSDSEEEQTEKPRKKKPKSSRLEPLILKEIPPPQCLQNSLDFLKKRKMQVARSSAVLNNSSQALRFISTSGLLGKN